MVWTVDRGLDRLLAQINEVAPRRSKVSDGSIGDSAHQGTKSDHNPESPPPAGNPDRQVDARDFTHDPGRGADMGKVSEAIRRSKDRRVLYVIFDRRIFSSYDYGGVPAWTWRPYSGSDPHTSHMHVSVNDVHHDEIQDWSVRAVTVFGEVWKTDKVKAPVVNSAGRPYADGGNKFWTAESYLFEILDDLRRQGAAVKARDEELLAAVGAVQPAVDVDVLASKIAAELIRQLSS